MNIFVTDPSPKESAKFLDDKRVNKMILESAQILSTALRQCGYVGSDIYKSTHVNHPSCIWARTTRSNYLWLLDHFKNLYEQKIKRTNKGHKSFDLYGILNDNAQLIPEGDLTPFVNCAANNSLGISYKHLTNVFDAYKLYLNDRWELDVKTPTWYGIGR